MKSIKLTLALAFLVLVAGVGTAGAQTDTVACYTWSCDWSTSTCTFDAACSQGSPFVWKVRYDYGDGSTSGLTGNGFQTHTFDANDDCASDVELLVVPWGGDIETVTCNVIHSTCPFGPGLPPSYASGTCTSQ